MAIMPHYQPSQNRDIVFLSGQSFVLDCSNCGKGLVDIVVTDPAATVQTGLGRKKTVPVQWKLKADCGYCGDHSFAKVINGNFRYSPHGENINVEDVDMGDDCITFITKLKVKK